MAEGKASSGDGAGQMEGGETQERGGGRLMERGAKAREIFRGEKRWEALRAIYAGEKKLRRRARTQAIPQGRHWQ